jgi:tetratricopeptide (TPR) repeat protein
MSECPIMPETRGSESEVQSDVRSDLREVSPTEIRAELRKILTSQRFRHAEQLRNFLSYIVEKTLAGHGDELKESVVAMEAFQRGSSFDPRLDAFVRVQAGRLRTALAEYYEGESRGDAVRIDIPKGSYTPVFSRCGPSPGVVPAGTPVLPRANRASTKKTAVAIAASVLILSVAGWFVAMGKLPPFRSRQTPSLAERGTIVVADFDNATGDPVFDGTIKQALLMDLEQSPALYLLPEQRVQETLRLMAHPPGQAISAGVARELCQRAGGQAALSGSIAGMGTLYVIGLTAVDCASGEVLAREQVRATGKEQVLAAVDKAAVDLRARLGESLASLQKYDTPLEQATTPSLKALQAYSEGISIRNAQGDTESVPYFQRAIELDSTFAMAYDRLGVVWWGSLKFSSAAGNFRKAFALREHVSQRERFHIESCYYHFVTGEFDKTLGVYQQWQREYPRDSVPHTGAAMIHEAIGEYEHAVSELQEALKLNPNVAYNYTNLAQALLSLDRRQEARFTLDDMQRHNLSEPDQFLARYQLAFLEGDAAEMQRQAALASDNPETSEILLLVRAQTEACRGRVGEMRRLVRQAIELATTLREGERAAMWQAYGALMEAEFGNRDEARQQAASALRLSDSRDTRILAALALARAGESTQAQMLAAKLRQEFPTDTTLNGYWLPVIEAAKQLHAGDAGRALAALEAAKQYELGQSSIFQVTAFGPMYPVYLRGEAFLLSKQGEEAAAEFQSIIAHPGLIQNFPFAELAHLELARALVLQGDRDKARGAYREFLARWKDADAGTLAVTVAKMELGRLGAD